LFPLGKQGLMNEPPEKMKTSVKYKLPACRHFTVHAFHPKAF